MDQRMLDTLNRGISAGGTGLTAKVLGLGVKDGGIRDALLDKGLLEKEGNRFRVTEDGFSFWEKEMPPERCRQVQDSVMRQFLEKVRSKQGKRLTAKELAVCPPQWRAQAKDRKLVEEVRANTFSLLPGGEELLAQLLRVEQLLRQFAPYKDRMADILKRQEELSTRLISVRDDLLSECEQSRRVLGPSLEGIVSDLRRRSEEYEQTVQGALREFETLPRFLEVLGRLQGDRESIDGVVARLGQQPQQVADQLDTLRETVYSAIKPLEEELSGLREALAVQGNNLESELSQLKDRTSSSEHEREHGGNERPTSVSDEDLFGAFREVHAGICKGNPGLGGSVRIPALFDRMRERGLVGSLATFHKLLERWEDEDRVSLWVCDNPGLEPRHAEGIRSGRGLLFYVLLK